MLDACMFYDVGIPEMYKTEAYSVCVGIYIEYVHCFHVIWKTRKTSSHPADPVRDQSLRSSWTVTQTQMLDVGRAVKTQKSGNWNVFICRENQICVCVCMCMYVSVWVCVPYAACQAGLSGTYWCAYAVVNNSSKRVQRWQLWCAWQFYSRTRQDLVTHVHTLPHNADLLCHRTLHLCWVLNFITRFHHSFPPAPLMLHMWT